MLIFAGWIFAGVRSPHDAQLWMPLAMLLPILSQHYLLTRASCEPILAAARARPPDGNAGPQAGV